MLFMESKIFIIKNVKNFENTKSDALEKIKSMVSPDANMVGDVINVKKETTWTDSNATITFTKKGKDAEIVLVTKHSATGLAMGGGCLLFLLTLIGVLIPWYLYEQDKKRFNEGLLNVLNYAVQQG